MNFWFPPFELENLRMKNVLFLVAGFAAFVAVGSALAGSAPEAVTVQRGCHGQVEYAPVAAGGCHGAAQMLAPGYSDAGCHGGRLTWGERRTARSAARANYQTTLAQFRDAGRAGSDLSAIPVAAAPTMRAVPAPVAAAPVCKCECECECKKAGK